MTVFLFANQTILLNKYCKEVFCYLSIGHLTANSHIEFSGNRVVGVGDYHRCLCCCFAFFRNKISHAIFNQIAWVESNGCTSDFRTVDRHIRRIFYTRCFAYLGIFRNCIFIVLKTIMVAYPNAWSGGVLDIFYHSSHTTRTIFTPITRKVLEKEFAWERVWYLLR